MPGPIPVTVLKLTSPAKDGNLKAFVDVQVGTTLIVHGCRVIQQPGQRAFVAPPQSEWTGQDGKKHYSPIVEWTGALKSAVETAVLDAWTAQVSRA